MSDTSHNRHYRLTHLTSYSYPEEVTSSYGRAVLLPRPGGGQQVHASRLTVTPEATEMRDHRDFHGNLSSYFHVTEPHTALQVRSSSVLTVTRRRADRARLPNVPWELAAQAARTVFSPEARSGSSIAGGLAIAESRLASPMVDLSDAVREYASPSFAPGRAVPDIVEDLCHRIYADFEYRSGSTTVRTRLPEVLERRTGVCQDFAHLLIGCVRSMGLAARYVSGYIETRPPAGQPKLRGVDASHAWASVWMPGGGWLHIDPTNDQFIDNRYVVLGSGRDYRDVSPLRGIVFTEGKGSRLEVGVDLWPIQVADLDEQIAEVHAGTPAT
ncbi:transglutaminase family protein [Pseudactinotalea suaedae]|uniref:transglutaminase family protein n=1 Tax=Pseudactinotalea suaedae TaxID=1524924 RepID=UPI0012E2614C|nr:transglutaminase family protein [Pseudactinotalea suaedae]